MGIEKQIAKSGRLEELTTNAKESLVGAINEVAAAGGSGGGGRFELIDEVICDGETAVFEFSETQKSSFMCTSTTHRALVT